MLGKKIPELEQKQFEPSRGIRLLIMGNPLSETSPGYLTDSWRTGLLGL